MMDKLSRRTGPPEQTQESKLALGSSRRAQTRKRANAQTRKRANAQTRKRANARKNSGHKVDTPLC